MTLIASAATLVTWVVLLGIGIAIGVLTRGIPRVLALVAFLIALVGQAVFNHVLSSVLMASGLSLVAVGRVLSVVGAVEHAVTMALLIAAAAIASRSRGRAPAAEMVGR